MSVVQFSIDKDVAQRFFDKFDAMEWEPYTALRVETGERYEIEGFKGQQQSLTHDMAPEMATELIAAINELEEFEPGVDLISKSFCFTRYDTGLSLREHDDIGTLILEGKTCDVLHSIVLFMSGSEGGELCFPEHGLKFKPKLGVGVAFTSGEVHSVNEVLSRHRYALLQRTGRPRKGDKPTAQTV